MQRNTFLIIGIFFVLIIGFFLVSSIMVGVAPNFIIFPLISFAIMCFSLYYLYPQFRQKDERMKAIRERGMFFSYFALIIYFFFFWTVLQFDLFFITARELLQILIALTISTVFLSFVVVSKRY
ncbi:hypothetical protein [Salsuginibacillus kocurii]|uniref:hypothetical protein n=1 Tax=Salsuginibacillus kocurii TaxID=427078 RepID=UPI00036A40FC|nr:hypothetical protein [Salsuginibacillus kocurii]